MMDQEIKAKWVEALRSGEYKQATGGLRTNDGCNCCLGVLAEMNGVSYRSVNTDDIDELYHFDKAYFVFDFGSMKETATVPDDYCGLSGDILSRLINMNDNDGKTFLEIADWIDENL